jgi:hypothetical protein
MHYPCHTLQRMHLIDGTERPQIAEALEKRSGVLRLERLHTGLRSIP